MEPISYMMLLFNEVVALGWYYVFILKPTSSISFKSHLQSRSLEKQWNRAGIKQNEINELEE
jgi:hypothetical protein